MKILFITSTRIGDAVLSSGILRYIAQTHPNAKVTVACSPLVRSLFEGYPLLERIIPLQKEKYHGHWIKLWRASVGTRWDMVVDIRDSAVSRLVFSKARYVFGKHIGKSQHKVEQMADVMGLSNIPAPKLWFSDAQMARAQELIPQGDPVIAVGPTANWIGKTWPADRFIETLQWLRKQERFKGARIAVFAAPGEEEAARTVYEAMPKTKRIDVIAKTNPGEAAAALSLCDFYLGNDSGLMHCAAACEVPTFGVFGPSYPHIYAPWGDHCGYARTPETFDELIDYDGYTPQTAPCLMESLSVEAVKKKLADFI